VRVAFQGEPGAYSEEAAVTLFRGAETVPCVHLADAFEAVAAGRADRAVVPAENSQAGSINETYDLLLAHDLVIGAELDLRVSHCLMAVPGQPLAAVTRVYSHPQALAQCEAYLRRLGAEPVPFYDTAGSAKMIHQERRHACAAIASRRAAEIYGLEILAEGIETNRHNFTRFLAIGRVPAARGALSKTTIVFGVQNRPGSLYRVLASLATREINLSKLESRPGRTRPWEYVFYVDFDGHADDAPVQAALEEMRHHTSMLRVLGSYPPASPPAIP
jgi:prephenate dehydratase